MPAVVRRQESTPDVGRVTVRRLSVKRVDGVRLCTGLVSTSPQGCGPGASRSQLSARFVEEQRNENVGRTNGRRINGRTKRNEQRIEDELTEERNETKNEPKTNRRKNEEKRRMNRRRTDGRTEDPSRSSPTEEDAVRALLGAERCPCSERRAAASGNGGTFGPRCTLNAGRLALGATAASAEMIKGTRFDPQ